MDDQTQPQTVTSGIYKGSWKLRRRTIFCTLIFCAAETLYFTIWASDTALHQQIAVSIIALGGATIGSYVFGAVWDDHSIRRFQQDDH